MTRPYSLLLALLVAVGTLVPCHAENAFARNLTDYGLPLLGLGVVAKGLTNEGKDKETIRIAAEAMLASEAVVQVLKPLVGEDRPNGKSGYSFPSSHASLAFAGATVLAENHPKQKWCWYALAAGIAWSRVDLRAHHTHDVVAGALLGNVMAHQALHYNEDDHPVSSAGIALLSRSW
ncbi:phosphatase PAP2 family protein [bacterium]|nr:phosphatase PAP2 family protein [bacterium]